MSKIDPLDTIAAGFASTALLNSNFTKIEAAFENTLSRDGSTPNYMDAALDLNSNRIINLGDPVNPGDAVSLGYFETVSAITAFTTIQVAGQDDVIADVPSDTLTFVAGANVTLTTDAVTDTITITGAAGGAAQNLFETASSTSGSPTTAGTPTDTLSFVEGTNMTITGDGAGAFTFDAVGGGATNVFETVASSGESDIDATGGDTLNIESGAGLSIVTTPGSNTLTITNTGISTGPTAFLSEIFVDTVGYTAGVSNSITLAATPNAKESLIIAYRGLIQHADEYSLLGNVVTFTSTIPAGVSNIQVYILNAPVYESFALLPDQTIASAGTFAVAHGLASAPTNVELSLVCTTAEHGYSIGDVVPIERSGDNGDGINIVLDATNVSGRFGTNASVFNINNFTTGAAVSLTNGSWDLRVRAML